MNRFAATAALLFVSAALAGAQAPHGTIEWPYVGSEQAHTKYSAADEITAANVGELQIVWRWEPNETPLTEYGTRPGAFQATPIMIDNILCVSTMYTRVAALDAETGAELWTFDPKAYESGPRGAGPGGFKHRGIAYWSDGDDARIFLNSRDRLYAIDAATGELDAGFGESGSVLLTAGHGRPVSRFDFDQTSPPVVFEDLVIVGSRVPDRVQRRFDPPGTVQAYDARTGERQWHFQAVHHGVWDYDFNSPPNLVTITVDGHEIDAVAEVSKQGFTYVFDRVTGEPVWPIEERPADTVTDVPGEVLYPTQPFPTKPPPFSGQGVSLDDANDLTPEIHALAVEEMRQFRQGPLFTPPSLRGTLMRPTTSGGADWGGAAFDPETGLLYVRTSEGTDTNQVYLNTADDSDVDVEYSNNCPHGAAAMIFQLANRPGAARVARSRLGPIPLIKPPYAYLVAIDLNAGEIAWKVPFGEGSRIIRNHPLLRGVELPERLGTPGNPGPLVTQGGLVFIGGGDPYLYAFDKATGEEIWRGATPFRTSANPMTYRARSGRQFVVIAAGAGPDAALVAFARSK